MIKKRASVLLTLFAFLLATLACNFVTGGGNEEEVTLENTRTAFDQDGNNPTTVFAPTDIFYVVGDLYNAPAGTVVEAKWKAVQIDGYDPDELIYEQTLNDFSKESFTGTIYFQLSSDSGWPVGDYKADLYLNANFVASVPFSVQ